MLDWFKKVNLIQDNQFKTTNNSKIFYDEIIEYRTLLRNCFKTYIEDKTGLEHLINITNDILLKGEVHPQLINKNSNLVLEYVAKASTHNELLTIIAIEVVKLLNSSEFKYFKKCDNHKCSLYFIDASRNHSRRWCSMEICGNRAKVSKFAKKKKEEKN